MSGHSKWSQIKRKKEITDTKRGQVFSKLLRAISVAAITESNPQFNPTLRSAIEKAREYNVPQENIDRAITKSSEEKELEELLMEAYGPDGVAMLIVALTDNRNRTIAETKKILHDHGCKWADPGSVRWAFTQEGDGWKPVYPQRVAVDTHEALEKLYEALDDHNDVSEVYASVEESEEL